MGRQRSQGDYSTSHQLHTDETAKQKQRDEFTKWNQGDHLGGNTLFCHFTLFFFFLLLLELRCMETQIQRECQEQETWALDYTIPTPNWLSCPLVFSPSFRRQCKTLGEGTVGNLASQETTCYATVYLLLHNAAVSEWKISPSILSRFPSPISSGKQCAYMLTRRLAI